MSQLDQVLQRVKSDLTRNSFRNEAAVSQGVVLPILNALGWEVFDPKIVWPEYSMSGRRVDYALCCPPSKPVIFIEVKQVGQADGADKQLFEYAFHEGIPLAVLTDGQVWNFYLPSAQGSYADRRVYLLDISTRDVAEASARFERYLSFGNIKSGESLQYANSDYRDSSRKKQAKESLPEAWHSLLSEPDELLVELLADKAEALSGFSPDAGSVTEFLKAILATQTNPDAPRANTPTNGSGQVAKPRQPISEPPTNKSRNWRWPARNAEGYEDGDKFVVKSGAIMNGKPSSSLKGGAKNKYDELIRKGNVIKEGADWKLRQDVAFDSKAQATNVLEGYSQSANRVWI